MKVYDNYESQLVDFKTIEDKVVNMYVCGPTVYNYIHIGNARPVVFFDVVRRYLEHRGYEVRLISNITDVDDKIINKALELGVTERDISEKYAEAFINDIKKLNCKDASDYPKATEYIDDMIEFIQELINKEFAYHIDGDVYFRVSKIKDYGKLSNQTIEDLQVGARIDVNNKKENPLDFTLWKKTDVGVNYSSPWSDGRPGWHTECVVMINSLTKRKLDIHAGGSGLKFPHHENEIAQSIAMNDHTLASTWMHVGLVNVGNQKMSKSLGNFKFVKELLNDYTPNTLRLALLKTHYRQPISFTDELLVDSSKIEEKIINAYRQGKVLAEVNDLQTSTRELNEFESAMDNDFNTPNAVTCILDVVKKLNNNIRQKNYEPMVIDIASLEVMADVLGIELPQINMSGEEKEMYQKWVEARKSKDFESADQYRKELVDRGIL